MTEDEFLSIVFEVTVILPKYTNKIVEVNAKNFKYIFYKPVCLRDFVNGSKKCIYSAK